MIQQMLAIWSLVPLPFLKPASHHYNITQSIFTALKILYPHLFLFCCCCYVASVMSVSVWPHRWQPTRLPHNWNSPGENTAVGCHILHESEKWKWSRSVMSNSSWPHWLQPTSLLHLWDFPGKGTGVGCHCLPLLPNSISKLLACIDILLSPEFFLL